MKGKFFYQTLKSKLFSFNRCLQTILQARNKSSIISTLRYIQGRRIRYGRTKQQICECRPQMVCVSACFFCDQYIGYLPFITLTTASNWNQPFQQKFSASNILSHSFMFSLVGWPMASPLGREEAPEHFFRRTAITSPDCQEFMVWRIFSVVLIFMDPFMDEFTL